MDNIDIVDKLKNTENKLEKKNTRNQKQSWEYQEPLCQQNFRYKKINNLKLVVLYNSKEEEKVICEKKMNFSHRFLFLGSIIKKSLKSSIFFADGKDPEGPPYLQYEQVVPTRESNALIGGLLTVDENRADIPSITERTDSDPDFLEVDGIGLFGDDFSKKIQDEITSEKINQFPTGNNKKNHQIQSQKFKKKS